jgi:hypothetical protein
MTTPAPPPTPGRYPDPDPCGSSSHRYLDGTKWTNHSRGRKTNNRRPMSSRSKILLVVASVASVFGFIALAGVAGCGFNDSTNSSRSSTASTTTPPPRPDKHSQIANIALPPEASLSTDAPSSSGEETWDITASACTDPHGGFFDCMLGHTPSYEEVVADMDARLPVDHPLDGMPWCGRSQPGTDQFGTPHANTNWAWGTAADMVHVSVEKQDIRIKPGVWNTPAGGTFIFITRGPASSDGYTGEPARCKP